MGGKAGVGWPGNMCSCTLSLLRALASALNADISAGVLFMLAIMAIPDWPAVRYCLTICKVTKESTISSHSEPSAFRARKREDSQNSLEI